MSGKRSSRKNGGGIPVRTKTKLHFARFEFKYILPAARRKEVESELRYFLEFDPFVAATSHHQYLVRSLYFDDPFFTAYNDKVDGLRTRAKFRLRTYTDDPRQPAPYFLEIKGRNNNQVFKHRVQLTTLHGGLTERGGALIDLLLDQQPANNRVLQQFAFELHRKRLRPVALIDYQRRPYISRYDPEFRITFDDTLQATETQAMFPDAHERRRRVLPGGGDLFDGGAQALLGFGQAVGAFHGYI